MERPSANGANGRNRQGRFTHGCPPGPGNPHVRQTARLRSALLEAVEPEDIAAVIAKLLERALAGDVAAIRELLDRTIGKTPLRAEVFTQIDTGPMTQFASLSAVQLSAMAELLELAVAGDAKLLEQSDESGKVTP